MAERSWAEISAESDRLISQAMAEAQASAPHCNCGAVDVVGASHLDWCDSDTPDGPAVTGQGGK